LKGWLAASLVPDLVQRFLAPSAGQDPATREYLQILAGVVAILGHNYTCWLGFKGGKGIATSAGVFLALVPDALGIALGVWIVLFAATRYVSVASMAAAAVLPLAAWLTTRDIRLTAVAGVVGALAIYKHKANLGRLLAGTEHRIELGKKKGAQ
jgi:glycerol-3-phosphate acyltransferase PlsY